MRDFLDSLNNRDYAAAFWLIALLSYSFRSKSVRSAFVSVIQAATHKKILLTVALALSWTFLATYVAARLGFWSTGQIKTTSYWFLFAAIPTLASIAEASKDQGLILKPIKDSIKLAAVSEFFINLYSFPLLVELVLIPTLATLTAMVMIAGDNEQYKRVKIFLEWVMALIVLLIIIYQIRMIYVDPTHGLNPGNLRDLILPIYYTAAYIPCMFFIAVLVAYEEIFWRLKFVVKNRSLISYTKLALIAGFGINIRDLNKWFKRSWEEPLLSKDQINTLILAVKQKHEA